MQLRRHSAAAVAPIKLAPIGEVTNKAEPKRGNFLTRDELRVVLLDVFVGLRWGELSALRWSDIEIDRRVTPHGLRHTANNELRRVANGEVVRAIIGHATEAMTHHYSHVGEDEKREAAGTQSKRPQRFR